MSRKMFWLWVTAILILTAATHMLFLSGTAWDWDEPVYDDIARSVSVYGFPAFVTNQLDTPVVYPYHPPFHFYLLAGWYEVVGPGVISARILSSLVAIGIVAISMVITKSITKDEVTTLLVGGIVATDGWFAYSSLLVKLDTTALLIGLVGMYIFSRAVRQYQPELTLLAGLIIGAATIYKHVALIFVLAVAIHWLLTRKDHQVHLVTLATAGVVIVFYVLGRIVLEGDAYILATGVQVRRALGLQLARGLNYGLLEALTALRQTYWAFSGTLLFVAFAVLSAIYKAWLHWRRQQRALAPITATVLAAVVVLVAIRLRNPHYLVYLSVPGMILATIQITQWELVSYRLVRLALAVVCLLNIGTLVIRATSFGDANALLSVQEYFTTSVPQDAVVVADEPICAEIPQTCYRIGVYQSASRLAAIDPEVIVLYSSITQRPPDSDALLELISQGQVAFQVSDWKVNITVLVISEDFR